MWNSNTGSNRAQYTCNIPALIVYWERGVLGVANMVKSGQNGNKMPKTRMRTHCFVKSIYLSIYLSIYPSMYVCMYVCMNVSIYLSVCLSVSPFGRPSIHLSIYLVF